MNNENSELSFDEALANLEKVYNEVMADNQSRINNISKGYNKLFEELADIRKSQEQIRENNIKINKMLDEHERVCDEIHTCYNYLQKLQDKNYGPIRNAKAGALCRLMAGIRVDEAAEFAAKAANATTLAEIEEYAAKADECAKQAAKDAKDAIMFAERAKKCADELNTEEAASYARKASTHIKPTAELAAAVARYAEEAAKIAQAAKEAAYANEPLSEQQTLQNTQIKLP